MSVDNREWLPLTGYVSQNSAARGYWEDLWVDTGFEVTLTPTRPVTLVRITGFIPDDIPGELGITITLGERQFHKQVQAGHVCLVINVDLLLGPFRLALTASGDALNHIARKFSDERRLIMVLKSITFEHLRAPRGRELAPLPQREKKSPFRPPWRRPRSSKQRVYLHIGMPKTGTSVIQHMLLRNSAALWDSGLFYPVDMLTGKDDRWVAHHNLALSLFEDNDQCWDVLHRELARNKGLDAILSSEAFSNLRRPDRVKYVQDRLTNNDVQLIVYIRRQDEFIESLYHNYIMHDSLTQTFGEFFRDCLNSNREHGSYDYWHILNTYWAPYFGSNNISLRIYSHDMFQNGNILHDFLNTLGIRRFSGFDFNVPAYTRSLSAFELELFRQIKMRFAEDPETVARVRHHLLHDNDRALHAKKKLIAPEQSRDIMTAVRESNERLVDTYLAPDDRQLFHDRVQWAPMADYEQAPTQVSNADITALLEKISPTLAQKFNRLNPVS